MSLTAKVTVRGHTSSVKIITIDTSFSNILEYKDQGFH